MARHAVPGTIQRVSNENELAAVVERERLLLEPAVRADRSRVTQLLHPDFVEFGASGRVWDRASIIESLAADPAVSGAATDLVPVRLAENVVLLTYRLNSSGTLRSSVWVRESGAGWQCRFHQGTRVISR